MSIKLHRRAGFTLIELLFFVILATIVVVAGVNLATNFMRTVAFLTNSVDLDTKSRLAADGISREIRQCDAVESSTTNSIVLRLGTNLTTYIHRPQSNVLARVTAADDEVILSNVEYVRFDLFQHQPSTGPYDIYPAAVPANCKIVQLNWVCTRYLLGFKANTTTMQSAKVVIRKK
jgi:Tfp pilus assembly protein FimT